MTLSAGQVSLGVSPDTKGFGAKLHEGIMAESGGLFGIGKELGGHLMEGLGTIGIALGVGEFVKKGVEEYASADALNAQFTAGIQSTGNAANLSVKGMDELAKSISGYSGQSYDSIGKTEQVLQTFTNLRNVGPDKIFDDATTAAANMAAKLGGDASSSAIQLGIALNDPVKGVAKLHRIGVAFTQGQMDQIKAMQASGDMMGAQKVILSELNTEFGGAAKAAGQTLPGEIARSKVAFGELTKAVMTGVMPFVTPMIGGIADAMNKATPHIEHFAEVFKEKLHKVGEALAPAKESVAVFFDGIKTGANSIGDGSLLDSIGKFGNRIHAVFEGAKPVIEGLWAKFKPVMDGIGKAVAPVLETFKNLLPTLTPLIPQIVGLATSFSPLQVVFKAIQPLMPQLMSVITQLASMLAGTLGSALTTIVPLFVQLSGVISNALGGVLAAVLPAAVQLITMLAKTIGDLLPVVMPIIAVIVQLASTLISQLMPIITQLITSILPPVVKIFGMIMSVIAPLITMVAGLLIPVIQALMPVVVTVFGVIAKIIEAAMQIVLGVIEVVTGVITGNWSQVWNGIVDIVSGIWNTIIAVVVGAFTYIGAVFNFWMAILGGVIQFGLGVVGDVFNWLWNSVIAPIGQWIGGAVHGIGDAIGNVFGGIGATIRGAFDGVVSFIRGVINSVIDVVNGAIGSINGIAHAVKDATGGAVDIQIGTIPHLASGGTIRTPGTALVGENGPEIVRLPAGATVYPHGTGPGTSKSDGTTFNIFEAVNGTAVAQTVMQHLTARRV